MRFSISAGAALVACLGMAWYGPRPDHQPITVPTGRTALALVQQQPKQPSKQKQKAAAKQQQQRQSAGANLPDIRNWPPEQTTTVRLWFGHTDQQPTSWDGRLEVRGARLLRMRPWRFDASMSVDPQTASWKCGSWLGPEPPVRTFDVHLPPQPRPMLRPGMLIDLDAQGAAQLDVVTPRGNFRIDLAELRARGQATYLNGAVSADAALFGYPLAVRPAGENAPREWHDFPATAVSPTNPQDVTVCYQTYSQEAGGDRINVRRRVQNSWQAAEEVSAGLGDYYRTAAVHDGKGALWVVFAAQVEGNWDLYGRSFANG